VRQVETEGLVVYEIVGLPVQIRDQLLARPAQLVRASKFQLDKPKRVM